MAKQHLLAAWGYTVTAGYLLNQIIGGLPHDAVRFVMAMWVLIMIPPVWMTVSAWRSETGDDRPGGLSWFWVAAVVLLLAENVWAAAYGNHTVKHFSFRTIWFLLGAVGFAYTATAVHGTTRKRAYAVWAALNAVGVVLLLLFYEQLETYVFLALAVIQGAPMLLDLRLRRAEKGLGEASSEMTMEGA